MKYAALVASVLSFGGCATTGGDDSVGSEQDVTSTSYVDLMDFPKVDQGQWYDLIRKLNTSFTHACGDTYCEGDYSNLTPLTFACSATSKAGNVHECVWTFGAADVEVDTRTAGVLVNSPTFQCKIAMKTTATKLVAILAATDNPLDATIPGAPGTIGAQLTDCFDHPIGATPITFATTGTPSYVAASTYYATTAGKNRWTAANKVLLDGFNNVCGDTFCSSDFSDMQSMKFECAITKSTGNVKSCAWVFVGSSHWVVATEGGKVEENSQAWRCNVPVKGTLSQLLDNLNAPVVPGQPQPIDRPLPGVTTSAYDALSNGCLP